MKNKLQQHFSSFSSSWPLTFLFRFVSFNFFVCLSSLACFLQHFTDLKICNNKLTHHHQQQQQQQQHLTTQTERVIVIVIVIVDVLLLSVGWLAQQLETAATETKRNKRTNEQLQQQ